MSAGRDITSCDALTTPELAYLRRIVQTQIEANHQTALLRLRDTGEVHSTDGQLIEPLMVLEDKLASMVHAREIKEGQLQYG